MYEKLKKRVFEVIEKGVREDTASVVCDIVLTTLIIVNIISVFLETFAISDDFRRALAELDKVSVIIFTIEYVLRVWTSTCMFPESGRIAARFRYIVSGMALVDLCAFLPFYLAFFPLDLRVLRALRLLRLLRLLKVNRYTTALHKILSVIKNKASELVSSIAIIFLFMMIVSVLIYAAEAQAQPEAFQNGFSGLWWAGVTFTTVGYGDVVPITAVGRILSVFVVFLGMILVAVPTGIISSGFMEESEKERLARKANSEHKDLHAELESLKDHIAQIEAMLEEEQHR